MHDHVAYPGIMIAGAPATARRRARDHIGGAAETVSRCQFVTGSGRLAAVAGARPPAFKPVALFSDGEWWRAPKVEIEMGWSRSKTHGMLQAGVEAGVPERGEEPHKSAGAPLTYRLSEGFRAAVKKGAENAAKRGVAAKTGECAADLARTVGVGMDHLANEAAEMVE